MAIRITCPGCETALKLGDDKRGKKIRCPECEKVISIPSAAGVTAKAPAPKSAASAKAKPRPADDDDLVEPEDEEDRDRRDDEDDDDDDDDEEDDRRKKKRSDSGFPVFWIGIAAAIWLLLAGGGWLTYYLVTRPPAERPAPQQQQQGNLAMPPKPPAPPGGAGPKKPQSLAGNIRARAHGTARDAEMLGIVTLHLEYCELVKNPQARSLEKFLEANRTAPGETTQRMRDKHYTINFDARPLSSDIVVFETEQWAEGYYCFRANKENGFVSVQEMKAAKLVAP